MVRDDLTVPTVSEVHALAGAHEAARVGRPYRPNDFVGSPGSQGRVPTQLPVPCAPRLDPTISPPPRSCEYGHKTWTCDYQGQHQKSQSDLLQQKARRSRPYQGFRADLSSLGSKCSFIYSFI